MNFWFVQFWNLVWIISRNSNQRISRFYFTIVLGQKKIKVSKKKVELVEAVTELFINEKRIVRKLNAPLQPLWTGLQKYSNIRILEGQWRYSS